MTRGHGMLLRLAVRNVARNARRSLLTALAMVVGLALLVFSRAIADGAHEDWIRGGVRLGDGHIVLESPRYAQTGDLADRLGPAALAAATSALTSAELQGRIEAAAPRLAVSALASSAAAAVPIQVIGVDPAAEAPFSLYAEKRVEGRFLTPDDQGAAYIGARLARRLNVHLGSRIVVTAQAADGQIADQLFRVVGVFRTGLPEADQGVIQVPIAAARTWLRVEGAATQLGVLVASSRDVEEVAGALRRVLHARAETIAVLDWRHAMPELDAAVRLDDYGDYLIHGLLFAIVALAIVNTMLMSVLHRARELGVLRALGLTRLQTGTVVFTEGLVLTAASGLVGLVIGAAGTWLFFRRGLDYSALMGDVTMSGTVVSPVIVPTLGIPQLLQSLVFIAGVGVLSALYPAWRATRVDLVEAMKFDA